MAFELKDRIGVSNVSQTTLSTKTPGAAGSTVAERARNKKAADPVCIEMPVRVRGIGGLPIAGTNEIGQDFSEDTRTLIVMAVGAVVRLTTRVKKGQLLGLRHLRTEQEVSCRVVNVRSSGTPEDYVEVEFTQRATGFWGIHFPNDPRGETPVAEAAPTPGEVEAERVIFGGGHTERGNVTVAPATTGTPAREVKADAKAPVQADVKVGPGRGNSLFADLVKTEPGKAAPVDAPGFSGLSKSAEEVGRAAERVAREDALIREQTQTNLISFPGPASHQEQANIFHSSGPETQQPVPLDFSPVEDAVVNPALTDAEVEHAAIAKAIEEKAAREKAAAERAAAEKAAAEKAAAEKAAAERLVAAQLELERKEAERRGAERIAAVERARLLAETRKKQEVERMAAEIAARNQETDDVEVGPSPYLAASSEVDSRPIAGVSGAVAPGRTSLGTGLGGTAYGTLEEEIQRDRAALKTSHFKKSSHVYLVGAAAGAALVLLAAGGWWYMHNSAKVETAHTAAPTSLPANSMASAATAPAGVKNSGAAANPANSSTPNARGASASNTLGTSGASGSTAAAVRPQPVQPPAEKKVDSKKTASGEADTESEPAKNASADVAKPSEVQGKPTLKATLSAPVMVKRNSSAGGDVAAPDINAAPVSGTAALPLGAVTSSSSPAAPPTGGHAVPPRLLKSAAAEYPTLARQRHIEGDVVVQAEIDEAGSVKAVKAISGSELLREAALSAVRQFKYTPAQLDGSTTTSQVLVTVKFRTK